MTLPETSPTLCFSLASPALHDIHIHASSVHICIYPDTVKFFLYIDVYLIVI